MASFSTDSSNRSPARKRASKAGPTQAEEPPRKTLTRKSKTQVLSAKLEPLNTNEMIATAAYYLAEQRQFAPGNELEDWLAAERQLLTAH
jgi:hypothetical protein